MFKKNIFAIPQNLITRQYIAKGDVIPQYRNDFMRDRDRIIYCTAFRRLAGKTQIYTIGEDDHKKNRLTHSLEVAQISRTICRALGLNEDLAEAISLGHDLGHAPFGHAGERMLHEIMVPGSQWIDNSIFKDDKTTIKANIRSDKMRKKCGISTDHVYGFKHNIQSVRLVAVIEDGYRDKQGNPIGLNLTNYTLWGILNHTDMIYKDYEKNYPNYQNLLMGQLNHPGSHTEAWSFEAYIVRIADMIAQWHHDLEDAVRGRALSIKQIRKTINNAMRSAMDDYEKELLNDMDESILTHKCVTDLSHILVHTLVTDIIENSKTNLKKIRKEINEKFKNDKHSVDEFISEKVYREYDDLHFSIPKDKVICLSDKIKKDKFDNLIVGSIHHSQTVERMNEKGRYIIRKLFQAYYAHPQQLPDGPIVHYLRECHEISNIDDMHYLGSGKIRLKFEESLKDRTTVKNIILMRRICDYIASMTDRFAMEEYRHLYV